MKYLLFLLFSLNAAAQQSPFDKGASLFRKKAFAEAELCFRQEIAQNPGNLKAIEYLGDISATAHRWEQALGYYRKLKTAMPSQADYHYKYGGALGMLAKESGRLKALTMIGEVKESFLKAVALDPKHIGARWALVELYLQLPAIAGGSERKARRYAGELSTISAVDGYLAKARIAEYFERYPEAEKHYRSALAVGKSLTCYQKLADLYKNKMNLPQKAKEVMSEYHQTNKI